MNLQFAVLLVAMGPYLFFNGIDLTNTNVFGKG